MGEQNLVMIGGKPGDQNGGGGGASGKTYMAVFMALLIGCVGGYCYFKATTDYENMHSPYYSYRPGQYTPPQMRTRGEPQIEAPPQPPQPEKMPSQRPTQAQQPVQAQQPAEQPAQQHVEQPAEHPVQHPAQQPVQQQPQPHAPIQHVAANPVAPTRAPGLVRVTIGQAGLMGAPVDKEVQPVEVKPVEVQPAEVQPVEQQSVPAVEQSPVPEINKSVPAVEQKPVVPDVNTTTVPATTTVQQVDEIEIENEVAEIKWAQWSMWGHWSGCSVSCGGGDKTRARVCPEDMRCAGENKQMVKCGGQCCPVDGMWSGWQSRGLMRYRTCDSPKPVCGGRDCVGNVAELV